MSKIKSLKAFEVFDSRGNPTIRTVCELYSGSIGEASVPSGASTGSHEALELRDGDLNMHNGLGVSKAINFINTDLNEHLSGKDFIQSDLDFELIKLDGTKNKSRLGSNSILSVSIAFARSVAKENNIELYEYLGNISGNDIYKMPIPSFNIINGGKHAQSGLDIQEFMVVPIGFDSFSQKVEVAKKIVESLKKILEINNYSTLLGDEGGFAPKLKDNQEALNLISNSILDAGFNFEQVKIAIDSAANSFFTDDVYSIKIDGNMKKLKKEDLVNFYSTLLENNPLISIEDPFMEEDWKSFSEFKKNTNDAILIVGDDLTVTNIDRISEAKKYNSINSVIIKPNQIGTITETLDAVKMVKKNGWKAFASHRSGETMDTFISDLSVGFGCDFIKAGSTTKPERMCKYDRLIEIENLINK